MMVYTTKNCSYSCSMNDGEFINNYGRVLNIRGLRICQVSLYASVAQGSEYAWI